MKTCFARLRSRVDAIDGSEHLATYRASHVLKHLQDSKQCHILCSPNCFSILVLPLTQEKRKLLTSTGIDLLQTNGDCTM